MDAPLLTPSIEAEAHCQARLDVAPIIWLSTASTDGEPHTVPVWFCWDDPRITIFSQPGTVKVRHLGANGAVSFALDSAQHGTDIVCGQGRADLVPLSTVQDGLPRFAAKYAPMLGGQPVTQWLETFSQPVVVTVERLITWTRTADGLDYRSLPSPTAAG